MTPEQRAALDQACVAHFSSLTAWLGLTQATQIRVGSYIAQHSEASPIALELAFAAIGAMLYWPRCDGEMLRFTPLRPGPQQHGAFGIPACGPHPQEISAAELDVLIMPLLGFDPFGNRLGQGGGFYDRALSFCFDKPKRLGLAFTVQCVTQLPVEAFDQSLHALVSEQGLRFFSQ